MPPPSTVKIITESTAGRKNAYEFRPVSGKTGLYEIEVSVTEFNPYKAMAEQHQAFLEKTDNKLSGALKAGIKASTEND